jgi:hypothetical protein
MRLIGVVLALVLTASLAAEGQPAPKIPKIGLLTLATPAAAAPLVEAFRQELSAGSMSPAPMSSRSRGASASSSSPTVMNGARAPGT